MSDIGSFPTLVNGILHNSGPTWSFNAGEDITVGKLVGFAAAGASRTVVEMDRTASEVPIGVAIISASSGEEVTVALAGCIVTVVNADDGAAIDAGDSLIQNNNSVKGTVSAAPGNSDDAGAPSAGADYVIGTALEDIAGDAEGKALLNFYYVPA